MQQIRKLIGKKGTTKLRAYAKSGTCIAECDVQGLNEYQESKLQMSTQYMYLYENDLDILYAYYNDAAVECTWTSQNEDVATVKDGVITDSNASCHTRANGRCE